MGAQRVVAAVIERDGRYLVCRRPAHKRHGGLWEFPGGKCELGESDAEAVRRELREELGVEGRLTGSALFTAADPGSPFEIVFLPVMIVGEPVCHEHEALAWGTPAELLGMALAPSDRGFVEGLVCESGPGAK